MWAVGVDQVLDADVEKMGGGMLEAMIEECVFLVDADTLVVRQKSNLEAPSCQD